MNISLSGLEFKSNVQVDDELLMDGVIDKASSIKPMMEAVREYDAEINLAIAVLERHLGCNIYVASNTSTDEPAVITEDGDE